MAPRAIWKGTITVAAISCPVSLYSATSTSERVAFHVLNRKTGDRVHREYVDDETGRPVPAADQVKGYETGSGDYVMLEPEEIAAALPESDKTLAIREFIACDAIDDTYFDKPYYLLPSTPAAEETFVLIREGMRRRKVVAIAQAVLFRRLHSVLIRSHTRGLIATILNYDYEVRSASFAFRAIPGVKISGEMLELAEHIIKTKAGSFDPSKFDDRYEAALAELVEAKIEGRKIAAPKKQATTKPTDLLEALRLSAGTKASTRKASHTSHKKSASRAPSARHVPAARKAS